MLEPTSHSIASQAILRRLLPELRDAMPVAARNRWPVFERQLEGEFTGLFTAFYALYGERTDFVSQLEGLLLQAVAASASRPAELQALDAERARNPNWFQDHSTIGGVCYVDRFAGNLEGIKSRIPYFKSLGITYLHLMPLFECPEGQSDGGYAVSDYRRVNPALGSTEDLKALADELRHEGISLVLDFIYNHTSDQHEWALRAKQNEKKYLEFYYFFPDRNMPDRYEQHLREIFPAESPGSFSYCEELGHWVWTSFNEFQWDLNYGNPEVLTAMIGEMLFLANCGVEVLRLDAVAFAWKQMGTQCESLDPVYTLVEVFNSMARIAAPALLFKSEAIVHPDEVARYIAPDRCQLSYNPLLMALLWESLATRSVNLLRHSLTKRFAIHPDTSWVNYVRCHDDIGWTFSDEDAAEIGINGYDHRRFLNEFYTSEFEGSFARGVPFQFNAKTGDCRICGSTASLAGLEKALNEETGTEVELAIARVLLIYSVIFSIGGIPLIYLGDEMAVLSDTSYLDDEHRHSDSRWAQRPKFKESDHLAAQTKGTAAHRMFEGMQNLSHVRQNMRALAGNHCKFVTIPDDSVLAYCREHDGSRALVMNNFSERHITLSGQIIKEHLATSSARDALNGAILDSSLSFDLKPYQSRWLLKENA